MKLASPSSVYPHIAPPARSGGWFGRSKKKEPEDWRIRDDKLSAEMREKNDKLYEEFLQREAERTKRFDLSMKELQKEIRQMSRISEAKDFSIAVGKFVLIGGGIYAIFSLINKRLNFLQRQSNNQLTITNPAPFSSSVQYPPPVANSRPTVLI
jgi:hypothetical protein